MTLSLEEYVLCKSPPKTLTHVNFAYDSWNGLDHIHAVMGKVHGRIHPRNILALGKRAFHFESSIRKGPFPLYSKKLVGFRYITWEENFQLVIY